MGGLYRGSAIREENNIEQHYTADENGKLIFLSENSESYYKREFDAVAAYGWFGVGFSVYPFRNPSSQLRGLYFGFSGGLDILGVRVEDNFDDVVTESYFLRYEVGKDWWATSRAGMQMPCTDSRGVMVVGISMAKTFAHSHRSSSSPT